MVSRSGNDSTECVCDKARIWVVSLLLGIPLKSWLEDKKLFCPLGWDSTGRITVRGGSKYHRMSSWCLDWIWGWLRDTVVNRETRYNSSRCGNPYCWTKELNVVWGARTTRCSVICSIINPSSRGVLPLVNLKTVQRLATQAPLTDCSLTSSNSRVPHVCNVPKSQRYRSPSYA